MNYSLQWWSEMINQRIISFIKIVDKQCGIHMHTGFNCNLSMFKFKCA